MKTYSFNFLLNTIIFSGLAIVATAILYRYIPVTPKFKAGDCIVNEPNRGEFLELSDQSTCQLILQVGKESYLYRVVLDCDQNEEMKFFGEPREQQIRFIDGRGELTSADRCQQIPPKFKAGDCVVKNDDEYSCFLIKEVKDEEYLVIRDGFCRTKLSKKQESSVQRSYLERDSTVVEPSHCQ
jgi:hypothetical protein